MTDVVIASAARIAIGSYGRGLASVPPSDLGAAAASAALERAEIEPDRLDHVVFGNVIHTEPADAWPVHRWRAGDCPAPGARMTGRCVAGAR